MAQVCELTGRRPAYGNKVSHSNIKSRTRWMPNLRKKRYMIPELKQTISIMLSTRGIRTIDKLGGITQAIMAAKENSLSDTLASVRNKISKSRVKATAGGKVTPKVKVKHSVAAKEAAPAAAPAKTAKAKAPKAAKAAKPAKK